MSDKGDNQPQNRQNAPADKSIQDQNESRPFQNQIQSRYRQRQWADPDQERPFKNQGSQQQPDWPDNNQCLCGCGGMGPRYGFRGMGPRCGGYRCCRGIVPQSPM